MTKQILCYTVVFMLGFLGQLIFDQLFRYDGLNQLADIHSLLSPTFMPYQYVLKTGLITIALLIYIRFESPQNLADDIRIGLVAGLLIVLLGLIDIATQLDNLTVYFLAQQLAPLNGILLLKVLVTALMMAKAQR